MDDIFGVDTVGYPGVNGPVTITVVLVQGQGPDVACYAGVAPPAWVAHEGRKISLAEARRSFPAIDHELAERGLSYRGPLE